jgi:hypothetical protein
MPIRPVPVIRAVPGESSNLCVFSHVLIAVVNARLAIVTAGPEVLAADEAVLEHAL